MLGLDRPYTERFDNYSEFKDSLTANNKSYTPPNTQFDATLRYTWDMNIDHNVVPKEFPEFTQIFGTWGKFQKQCILTVAEMVAIGLGLKK